VGSLDPSWQALIEEWTLMRAGPIADPMTRSPMALGGLTEPLGYLLFADCTGPGMSEAVAFRVCCSRS
jgi:hypothetical protein